ncbi:ATP-binding protein [candidate division WOR-3 bacterium]|nr:ATP-binding protein [candidate division WOR-3 bacterium]
MRRAIDVNPIIILSGARQTGKSTLLKNEQPFTGWRYLSFDDIDVLGQAKDDPKSILSIQTDTVIDEIQKAPEVLPVIKSIVDENRERRFLLSGSANLLLMKQVTETLAGRSTFFQLLPFSFREWRFEGKPEWFMQLIDGNLPKEQKCQPNNTPLRLFRGFLPPILRLDRHDHISLWWDGYVRTYLERDLRDLSGISSLSDFKKVMEILAIQSGCILNETDIARKCSMSQPTVHRYINLLETSHLFIKLRPFTKGKIRRIIKSPKGYFLDPGLACFLAGYNAPELIPPEFLGHLFETLILLNLSIIASLTRAQLFYWRTWGGREKEVDFVFEQAQKAIAIEVKLSQRVDYDDIQNIKAFMESHTKAIMGLVIYNGNEMIHLTKNIIAVPWTVLC